MTTTTARTAAPGRTTATVAASQESRRATRYCFASFLFLFLFLFSNTPGHQFGVVISALGVVSRYVSGRVSRRDMSDCGCVATICSEIWSPAAACAAARAMRHRTSTEPITRVISASILRVRRALAPPRRKKTTCGVAQSDDGYWDDYADDDGGSEGGASHASASGRALAGAMRSTQRFAGQAGLRRVKVKGPNLVRVKVTNSSHRLAMLVAAWRVRMDLGRLLPRCESPPLCLAQAPSAVALAKADATRAHEARMVEVDVAHDTEFWAPEKILEWLQKMRVMAGGGHVLSKVNPSRIAVTVAPKDWASSPISNDGSVAREDRASRPPPRVTNTTTVRAPLAPLPSTRCARSRSSARRATRTRAGRSNTRRRAARSSSSSARRARALRGSSPSSAGAQPR